MSNRLKKSIVKTLVYADVFDYPLTKEEIWQFLISDKGLTLRETSTALNNGSTMIVKKSGFYCFSGRTEIINKRLERGKESNNKIHLAEKIIFKLSVIPTVQLIGISGALAMKNSHKNDDIDLFVIAKKNTLWTTRLFLLLLLQIMGYRRKRNEKNVTDKFCLNMLMDESNLGLQKERQNLYTAHEVVQMMPLFERNSAHQKFIRANRWVEKFLPNAVKHPTTERFSGTSTEYIFSTVLRIILCLVLRFSAIEVVSKAVQLSMIRRHHTIEIISDTLLAFHPKDYMNKVLKNYKAGLKKYEI
ncbi:MAG: hypothetical protein Q8P80_05460 [Candidatus Levybacteria bacterium]|nr:hypothetical protein [Candidatus Levybacteria bacterium]